MMRLRGGYGRKRHGWRGCPVKALIVLQSGDLAADGLTPEPFPFLLGAPDPGIALGQKFVQGIA
jgi:hypothetical protein